MSNTTESGARYQADQHLRALLRYTESFYGTAIEHGMRAGETANAIAHIEKAARAMHELVHVWADVADARKTQRAEKQEPHRVEQNLYGEEVKLCLHPQPATAPMVPLTENDVWHNDGAMALNAELQLSLSEWMRIVRIVETAHGIKE